MIAIILLVFGVISGEMNISLNLIDDMFQEMD